MRTRWLRWRGGWGSFLGGARSLPAVVAWKTGVSPGNAHTMAAVARRVGEFPRCVQGLKEGRLSLDQVGVIAARAGEGSDEHYAELASVATVTQLRTAVRLEPRPDPSPAPESKSESGSGDEHYAELASVATVTQLRTAVRLEPRPDPSPAPESKSESGSGPVEPELRGSVSKSGDGQYSWWRIKLPAVQAATFDAALGSHLEGLMAQWKREREAVGGGGGGEFAVPMPTMVEAFLALVQAGWDSEVARRPQGQHTTVVMHV
ncbi:DUF222 domain-containing protein, partial [Mycobacterium bourgelatii]